MKMTKRIKAMLDARQEMTKSWAMGLMSYFPPVEKQEEGEWKERDDYWESNKKIVLKKIKKPKQIHIKKVRIKKTKEVFGDIFWKAHEERIKRLYQS